MAKKQNSNIKAKVENTRTKLFKHRMVEQDIAKGLMIFAVIFCHTVPLPQLADTILRSILGMVIPFFFFISGYNYKEPESLPDTFKGKAGLYWQRVKKRLRQILVPLLFCSLILLGIGAGYSFLTHDPVVSPLDMTKAFAGFWISEPISSAVGLPTIGTFEGIERLYEPNWFILHMTLAYVIFYAVVDWALSNKKRYISVMFGLIAVSCIFNFFHLKMPWGFENAAAYAAIMLMGCGVKHKNLFSEERYSKKYWPWINCAACFLICVALGFLWPRAGQISGSGQITKIFSEFADAAGQPAFAILEIPYTIIYSVISSYFLIWFCKLLAKVRPIKFFYSYMGRNSLMILVFHLVFASVAIALLNVMFYQGVPADEKLKMATQIGKYAETFEPIRLAVFALTVVFSLIFVTCNVACKERFRKHKKMNQLCKEKREELLKDSSLTEEQIKAQIKAYRSELRKTIKVQIA